MDNIRCDMGKLAVTSEHLQTKSEMRRGYYIHTEDKSPIRKFLNNTSLL